MLSDVIAALATPPGRSALAVVRVSGLGAFAVAGAVAPGLAPLERLPPRTAHLARFVSATGEPIDQGLVTAFPAPHSYTGHDLVELSCHGGLLAPAQLLAALQAAGARAAAPGEFTRRAVLNGKLDLLQAEAVGDLIDATAPAQGRAALRQLDGALSARLHSLRDGLLELQALLAYDIDFPEEDDGPVSRDRIATALEQARAATGALLATAPAGERLHDGALVVLAGRPNAGKSSLFNALLGASRALVTEIPGTTRDAIEAATTMEGWPVRLVDTAGLRQSEERLEQMGIEVSRRYLASADLVLLCAEAGRALSREEQPLAADRATLVVRTKGDLAGGEGLVVSVVSGEGIATLRRAMADRLFGHGASYGDLEAMLTRERHRVALQRAAECLAAAASESGTGGDAVLAAHQVRAAVAALDELIGLVHPDEVLGRVFARFCVGK